MTVVAVMDCGDSLLMGSDSLVTEDAGLRVTRPKLTVLPGRQIAFGFSGDEGVGFQFRDWLLAYRWPDTITWVEFGEIAITELSRLNGRRREMGQLARADVKDSDLAQVLVAGSVGGVLDVWELSTGGSAASAKHRGLAAIGSGYAHAFIAYIALTQVVKASPAPETMGAIMEIAARFAPMCGFPIRLLRLTNEHATELTRAPDGTWSERPAREKPPQVFHGRHRGTLAAALRNTLEYLRLEQACEPS